MTFNYGLKSTVFKGKEPRSPSQESLLTLVVLELQSLESSPPGDLINSEV